MAIFQKVTLSWNDKDFVVPADKVMGAISVVEDVVTYPELVQGLQSGKPNMSKLSRAYAALLRYAGAVVDDEEVYAGMFKIGYLQRQIGMAINALMVMMTPPGALAEATKSGNSPAVPSASSKRSSKRRSRAAG